MIKCLFNIYESQIVPSLSIGDLVSEAAWEYDSTLFFLPFVKCLSEVVV